MPNVLQQKFQHAFADLYALLVWHAVGKFPVDLIHSDLKVKVLATPLPIDCSSDCIWV